VLSNLKLIIQIPCYNEEEYLGVTLNDLPKKLEGIDEIEYLVIDDGSTDKTVEVAKKMGVNYVVKHNNNLGLARAFATGIENCLELGADIIVNTDADNQYCAADIEKLIKPILDGTADIVIGARPIDSIKHFSTTKKILQRIGSSVVRFFSNTDVLDATSGFRAISKKAAYHISIFSNYTYTLETIIQAGRKGLAITSVPIRVNPVTRPSKLIKSTFHYVYSSIITIFRIFIIYKPFRFFAILSLIFFTFGLALGFRFLYFFIMGFGNGHVQSLILMLVLIILGFLLFIMGLIADLIAINRTLIEDIRFKIRKFKK
jgi:glycosyltransferase involved in cell wall biosynthesis